MTERSKPLRSRRTRGLVLGAVMLGAFALGALSAGGASAGPSSRLTLSSLELSTIDQINRVRVAHGLVPLKLNRALFDSASAHCFEMIASGYFSHSTPSGIGIGPRIEAFYRPRRHRYYAVGENILWANGSISSTGTVANWMRSPEHRRNLLDPAWRQIGLATLSAHSAPGVFGGHDVTVVTVDFGVRQ
jgi:uncharacterized protein YkwD